MIHQFPGPAIMLYRIIPFTIVFFYSQSSAMEQKSPVPSAVIARYVMDQQKKIAMLTAFNDEKEKECRNLWYTVDALRLPAQQFAQEFKQHMLCFKGSKPLASESYYQILGLDAQKAKKMHYTDLMKHITSITSAKVSVLTQLEYRQAMVPLHTPFGKACYDAYLDDQLIQTLTHFQEHIIKTYTQRQ